MTINDMIANARTHAEDTGIAADAYWGEFPNVMKLLVAYYGGFNSASDMSNYQRVRGQ